MLSLHYTSFRSLCTFAIVIVGWTIIIPCHVFMNTSVRSDRMGVINSKKQKLTWGLKADLRFLALIDSEICVSLTWMQHQKIGNLLNYLQIHTSFPTKQYIVLDRMNGRYTYDLSKWAKPASPHTLPARLFSPNATQVEHARQGARRVVYSWFLW
jgi:hypothetical protein